MVYNCLLKDHCLQFSSHQPLQHKLGVIRTLRHRCNTICSTEEAKLKEIDHLKKVLSVSGYTKSAWDLASRNKEDNPTPPQDSDLPRAKKQSVTLPYVGRTSDSLAHTIQKAGVIVHMKPTNTLRSHLVHPKDKLEPGDKAGTVYHVKCGECDNHYVGETERQLNVRVSEHQKKKSAYVHQHLKQHNHTFSSKDDVSVLQTESDWFKRGVAESIHILRKRPTINRDKGRHTLPPYTRGSSSHLAHARCIPRMHRTVTNW